MSADDSTKRLLTNIRLFASKNESFNQIVVCRKNSKEKMMRSLFLICSITSYCLLGLGCGATEQSESTSKETQTSTIRHQSNRDHANLVDYFSKVSNLTIDPNKNASWFTRDGCEYKYFFKFGDLYEKKVGQGFYKIGGNERYAHVGAYLKKLQRGDSATERQSHIFPRTDIPSDITPSQARSMLSESEYLRVHYDQYKHLAEELRRGEQSITRELNRRRREREYQRTRW